MALPAFTNLEDMLPPRASVPRNRAVAIRAEPHIDEQLRGNFYCGCLGNREVRIEIVSGVHGPMINAWDPSSRNAHAVCPSLDAVRTFYESNGVPVQLAQRAIQNAGELYLAAMRFYEPVPVPIDPNQ